MSFDVVNLYSNIPHSLGLQALDYWLSKYPNLINERFTKEFILQGAMAILENNNFTFNGICLTEGSLVNSGPNILNTLS